MAARIPPMLQIEQLPQEIDLWICVSPTNNKNQLGLQKFRTPTKNKLDTGITPQTEENCGIMWDLAQHMDPDTPLRRLDSPMQDSLFSPGANAMFQDHVNLLELIQNRELLEIGVTISTVVTGKKISTVDFFYHSILTLNVAATQRSTYYHCSKQCFKYNTVRPLSYHDFLAIREALAHNYHRVAHETVKTQLATEVDELEKCIWIRDDAITKLRKTVNNRIRPLVHVNKIFSDLLKSPAASSNSSSN